MDKVYPNQIESISDIHDGASVMMDGFGGPGGMAQELILALRDRNVRDLTLISNSAGVGTFGVPQGKRSVTHGILIENGQVKKMIASFPVGRSPSDPTPFELAYRSSKIELELVPQGTLAERIRIGGAGIAAFYTPTGVGTPVAEGKESKIIDDREYLLEHALVADFAFIHAEIADTLGNLKYKGTSRNFNMAMATAANITIVEADQIVEPGGLDPEIVATPGIYVNRIVKRNQRSIYTENATSENDR